VDPSLDFGWYEASAAGELGVPRFRLLGEHVPGGLAELCVVPAANLVRIPDTLDFEGAAAAGLVGVTAWHALIGRAALRPGETVLVTGASGGVSTMGIQIARMTGARVLALTSGPENARRVRELGAHAVYDRLDGDWAKALWADTGKRGVDVVLDSVGAAIWGAIVRSLAPLGRVVTYGATSGPRAETELRSVFWKQLSIIGATMGTPAEFRTVMRLVAEGHLHPVVHAVLPLAEARRGHELLEHGDVFGKLVVTP